MFANPSSEHWSTDVFVFDIRHVIVAEWWMPKKMWLADCRNRNICVCQQSNLPAFVLKYTPTISILHSFLRTHFPTSYIKTLVKDPSPMFGEGPSTNYWWRIIFRAETLVKDLSPLWNIGEGYPSPKRYAPTPMVVLLLSNIDSKVFWFSGNHWNIHLLAEYCFIFCAHMRRYCLSQQGKPLAEASARGLGGFGQDLRSIWQPNSRLGRRSARACAEADFRETSGTT